MERRRRERDPGSFASAAGAFDLLDFLTSSSVTLSAMLVKRTPVTAKPTMKGQLRVKSKRSESESESRSASQKVRDSTTLKRLAGRGGGGMRLAAGLLSRRLRVEVRETFHAA